MILDKISGTNGHIPLVGTNNTYMNIIHTRILVYFMHIASVSYELDSHQGNHNVKIGVSLQASFHGSCLD